MMQTGQHRDARAAHSSAPRGRSGVRFIDLDPNGTANIVRRHELAGLISPDQAAQAHADLLDLAIEHWPHEILAARAWELRLNLSIYDASCVALAELLGAP